MCRHMTASTSVQVLVQTDMSIVDPGCRCSPCRLPGAPEILQVRSNGQFCTTLREIGLEYFRYYFGTAYEKEMRRARRPRMTRKKICARGCFRSGCAIPFQVKIVSPLSRPTHFELSSFLQDSTTSCSSQNWKKNKLRKSDGSEHR